MAVPTNPNIPSLPSGQPADTDQEAEGAGWLRLLIMSLKTLFVTPPPSDNSTTPATTAYVQTALLNAVLTPGTLPAQSGNAGKALLTNGSTVFWGATGLTYEARSANTQLVAGDSGKFLDLTTSFTQTFDTPTNLGSPWNIRIRNAGTGQITIPSSDGVTNWIMYSGEVRDFNSNGTTLRSVVVQGLFDVETASGNFIKPPGYSYFDGLLWAAGGSGGKNGGAGCGGGGGACLPFRIPASSLSATNAFVIGAGGSAQAASGTPGNVGGNSTFGGLTAYGGFGGGAGTGGGGGGGIQSAGTSSTGGRPYVLDGTLTNAGADNPGFGGGPPGVSTIVGNSVYGGGGGSGSSSGAQGGVSVYGGGGGGQATAAGAGGVSLLGGSGGAGGAAVNGVSGGIPGGGGGGSNTGTQSGAGGRGELRVWGIV